MCSLWCLAGLASSEITGLAGVGRLGFRMQLYGGALTPVMGRSSGVGVVYPSC